MALARVTSRECRARTSPHVHTNEADAVSLESCTMIRSFQSSSRHERERQEEENRVFHLTSPQISVRGNAL